MKTLKSPRIDPTGRQGVSGRVTQHVGMYLYSLEVPPTGGNTSFCTMYGIYGAIPARLKDRIVGLKIKHNGTYNSGGYVRQGVTATDDPLSSPGAVHPLVCVHPDTGRRMLYLGRRRNAYLVGLDLKDSERRCSTNCGASSIGQNSLGSMSGALAISFCGTIAARCIGATPLTQIAGGLCIVPRSKATRGRSDAQIRHSEGAPHHRAHLMIAVESSKRQQICQRLRIPFAKSSEAVGNPAVVTATDRIENRPVPKCDTRAQMRHALFAAFVCFALADSAIAQQQQPTAVPVGVVRAAHKPIARTTGFVGRVEAISRIEIRARITGFLDEVQFKEGDLIEAGAPLYRIEKGLFQAQVEQAEGASKRRNWHDVVVAMFGN